MRLRRSSLFYLAATFFAIAGVIALMRAGGLDLSVAALMVVTSLTMWAGTKAHRAGS